MTSRLKGTTRRRYLSWLVAVLSAGLAAGIGLTPAAGAAIDETGPTINMNQGLFIKVGTVLSNSSSTASFPANVTWTQYDPAGICSQTAYVQAYVPGQGWRYTYPSITSSSKQFTMDFTFGGSYYVYLTATDCLGNVTNASGYYYPRLSQETSATLDAGWSTSACACWSGGNVVKNSIAGRKASLTFSANTITVVSNKALNRGTAKFYIDGVLRSTVNLSAPTLNRVVVFQKRFPNSSTHTIDVVVGSGRVDVDAFVTG